MEDNLLKVAFKRSFHVSGRGEGQAAETVSVIERPRDMEQRLGCKISGYVSPSLHILIFL